MLVARVVSEVGNELAAVVALLAGGHAQEAWPAIPSRTVSRASCAMASAIEQAPAMNMAAVRSAKLAARPSSVQGGNDAAATYHRRQKG